MLLNVIIIVIISSVVFPVVVVVVVAAVVVIPNLYHHTKSYNQSTFQGHHIIFIVIGANIQNSKLYPHTKFHDHSLMLFPPYKCTSLSHRCYWWQKLYKHELATNGIVFIPSFTQAHQVMSTLVVSVNYIKIYHFSCFFLWVSKLVSYPRGIHVNRMLRRTTGFKS
jgi:hypothetical protein